MLPSVNPRWEITGAPSFDGINGNPEVLWSDTKAGTVAVGDVTSATVTGLTAGLTYFFVAVDYNSAGLESSPSNQVSFTATPTPTPTPRPTPTPTPQPTPTPTPPSGPPIVSPTRGPSISAFAVDLNGDGHSDLLWFNQTHNLVAAWLMNGNTVLSTAVLGHGPIHSHIAGVADLMNTGRTQIIWYNGSKTYVAWSTAWSANNTPSTTASVFSLPADYPVLVFADFDGDGMTDVVQWNPATGAILIAKNKGSLNFTTQWSGSLPPHWTLIGTADLNGDGQHELIWRNQNTGQVQAWVLTVRRSPFGVWHFPFPAISALFLEPPERTLARAHCNHLSAGL